MNKLQLANGVLSWITGTKSEVNGKPVSFFHATRAQFNCFDPYTHFGTKEAACERAGARSGVTHQTLEVWLAIRKPLHVVDDQANNQVSRLLYSAFQEGVFQKNEFNTISDALTEAQYAWEGETNTDERNRKKWKNSMKIFVDALAEKGYDALSYNNTVEGGISYMPFFGRQIWWTNRDIPET